MTLPGIADVAELPGMTGDRREAVLNFLSSGEYNNRITSPERLKTIDAITLETCLARFAPGSRLRVHDLACSDGLTSLELFRALAPAFDLRMEASDLHLSVCLVETPTGRLLGYGDGVPIDAALRFPFSLRSAKGRSGRLLRLVAAVVRAGGALATTATEISLLHPDVRDALPDNGSLTFHERDILRATDARYDLIRVSNLFHSWPDEAIVAAIRRVTRSLDDGGLLIVAYGQETRTRRWKRPPYCSFFEKRNGSLALLRTLETAEPIQDLILDAGRAPA